MGWHLYNQIVGISLTSNKLCFGILQSTYYLNLSKISFPEPIGNVESNTYSVIFSWIQIQSNVVWLVLALQIFQYFLRAQSSSKSHKFSSKKLCSGFRINVALTSTICKPELVCLPLLTTKYLRELSKLFEQIFSYAIFSKTSQDLAIQPKEVVVVSAWTLLCQS